MKELRLSIALLEAQESNITTAVVARKSTHPTLGELRFSIMEKEAESKLKRAAIKAASLREEREAKNSLDGVDYCLAPMSRQDMERSLQLAAQYRFEQLLEKHFKRMDSQKSSEKFFSRRRSASRRNALEDINSKAEFMVDETLYQMKETLALKGKSFGEVKCLLKGLATEAAREASSCRGLDRAFYKRLSQELWSNTTVRWMLKK